MTGRRVSVRYNGDADDVYLGYETCVNADGTLSIRYDDGEKQSAVDPRWVTYVSHVTPASMRVGLRIEVGQHQSRVPRHASISVVPFCCRLECLTIIECIPVKSRS